MFSELRRSCLPAHKSELLWLSWLQFGRSISVQAVQYAVITRKSQFWHYYVESAVVECCSGLRGINFTGQIQDAEHQLRVPMRMGVLFRFGTFARLGFSADAQSARFETHFDLLPMESRDFGACGKLFARFREVELHRRK